jgi:hypothetical protein
MSHLDSKVSYWALKRFTLESGLIVGFTMILAGTGIDAYILWHWIRGAGREQEATVHTAFVATLLVVLGLNVMFSSFLLNMFAIDQNDRDPRQAEGGRLDADAIQPNIDDRS